MKSSRADKAERNAIAVFATKHRLKTSRDGELLTIPGRTGTVAGTWADRLVVIIQRDTAKQWNNARRRLLALGHEVHQDGDTEGAMLFNPTDKRQVRGAISEAGIRPRRVASPAQLERLRQFHFQSKTSRATDPAPAPESTISAAAVPTYPQSASVQ